MRSGVEGLFAGRSRPERAVTGGLLALLAAALVIQSIGVFRRNVHWDEFLFLTDVYRAVSGERLPLLQTSYVYLFAWLPLVGGDEVDQVVIARGLYLVSWLGSLVLLYRLGRLLLDDRLGALAGVTLYALFPYTLVHSASFRIDGLLLPCLIAVGLLLFRPTWLRLAAAGLIGAGALALSLKAVLWAPAFLGIFLCSGTRPRPTLKLVIVGLAAGIAALASIYLARRGLLAAAGDGAQIGITTDELRSIAYRMLVEEGWFPNYNVFVDSLRSSGATWLMVAFGAILSAADLFRPQTRRAAIRLLLAASPVIFVLIYANAWQYAYVVLLPTTCLLAGRAVSFLVASPEPVRRLIAYVCIAATSVPLVTVAWAYRIDGQAHQRQILSIVHRLFPEPVAYIDKTGMVSSFKRQPFPLTGQVIKQYRRVGRPALTRFIEKAQPPLLIANSLVLDVWNGGAENVPARFRLLAEDEETIWQAYAPFWGPIYLAGGEWRDLEAGERVEFETLVAGPHTLLSDKSVMIDGRLYRPGTTVALDRGRHELAPTEPAARVRLLWGSGLEIPPAVPGRDTVFFAYGGA